MFARLMRFGAVGGAMTLLNYLLFAGAMRLGLGYLAAASLAWLICVSTSYLLNRSFTFRVHASPSLSEFAVFAGGCLLQLAFGLGDYALLIGRLQFDASLAFLINTALSAAFSFAFMRLAVFRPLAVLAPQAGAA